MGYKTDSWVKFGGNQFFEPKWVGSHLETISIERKNTEIKIDITTTLCIN